MGPTPLDSKKAGKRNEQLVLKLLREQGPLSQKELCQATQLGSSTASTIVARLRDKGLVIETPGVSSSRGPKPVMLEINPTGRYLLGAELSPTSLRIGLFNYLANPIDHAEIPLRTSTVSSIVEWLTVNALGLLTKNKIMPEKVEGLGVTVSGSVSPEGVIELSSTLGWKQVPLRELLCQHLDFPIHIFTTRVRLLAEMTQNPEVSAQNVLYLNIADGVGANTIMDGHLIHGTHNNAGEIGHIVVAPDGPICGCGHTGCLEALISGPALAKQIKNDLDQGTNSLLTDRIAPEDTHRTIIQKWGLALEAHDPYALSLQDLVAEHLSRVAAIAINLYDPQLIILAGYVSEQCFDALNQAIQNSLTTDVYDGNTRSLTIRPAQAGRSRYTQGAALAVLASNQ